MSATAIATPPFSVQTTEEWAQGVAAELEGRSAHDAIAWMFETFSTTLQQHRAGKVRILAYAHAKRAPIAPEIPTMIEAGVPGYEAYTFNLILGPAGMPQPVVDTLDQASRKLMADADMVKFLEEIAAVPTTDTTPERTAKFIQDEIVKWAPVIRAAGVKIE